MPVNAELHLPSGRIVIDTTWSQKETVKSLPGARYNVKDIGEKWSIPLSWAGCLALRSTFGNDLVIGPTLTAWATKEKTERIDPAMEIREAVDAPGTPDLYAFQRAGVEFIKRAERCLIGDDPGSGKTVQAIRGAAALAQSGKDIFPILVVAPNTMKKVWKREFEKWWPGVECSIVKGSATQRRKALATPAHVYIINWESLRSHSRLAPYGSIALKRCRDCGGHDERVKETSCEVHPRELNKFEFKTVIADEVHKAKDAKAKQTRALWAASGDAPYRIGLSGTPIANNVLDLWPILHWLDEKEWPSKTTWVDRMIDVMLNAFGGMMVLGVKPHMQDEFYATIYPHFRRMPEELVLPFLPPVVKVRKDVEMSPKQAKAYKQMKEQLLADLDSGLLTTPSRLTQMVRLSQLANAFLEVEEYVDTTTGELKDRARMIDPSSKLDDVMDDLEDLKGTPVAIMSVSRQLLEMLSTRLDKKKVSHGVISGAVDADERQRAIDDFQAGKTEHILFTAAAGGVGITLTAAKVLIRLQRPWSMVDDTQAFKRVHRIGSEIHSHITVYDYVVSGTVEEAVLEALDKKGQSFEDFVKDNDLLRRMLEDSDDD